LGGGLLLEAYYVLERLPELVQPANPDGTVGGTKSIGIALFTDYLLPFEVTSVLILMAIVGAMVLARREDNR
jgi:NADH-quinone oxidoreductase subunit J